MVAVTLATTAFLSLICGILILIWPKVINYLIGVYLIIVGILGIINLYG